MAVLDRTRLTDMLIRSEKMRPAGRKPSCGPLCAPRRAVLRVFQDHGQGRAAPGVARALGHAARGKARARVHQRPQHDAVPRLGGGRLDADAAEYGICCVVPDDEQIGELAVGQLLALVEGRSENVQMKLPGRLRLEK